MGIEVNSNNVTLNTQPPAELGAPTPSAAGIAAPVEDTVNAEPPNQASVLEMSAWGGHFGPRRLL